MIYNSTIKNKYLDQFENEDTKEVYKRIFKKSYELEEKKEKDLYNFDDNEFEYFLSKVLKPKTKESARTYCNVLANYVQWAIDNQHSKHLINPIKRRQEYYYEFVQEVKLYFSFEEKQAFIRSLTNKQDSFIIEALWNGIQGSKVSELVNLRISDVKPNENKIVLRNDEGEIVREVSFDNDTEIFNLALLANKEEIYYKLNGEADYSNVPEGVELSRSEYVLKSAKTKRNGGKVGGEKVSHYTVYNRLEMIRTLEDFEEYKDALTTKNIVRSGMIHMALKLYQRDGVLERKQIEEICERYNLKYKWSLRDFLNLDTISKLYPEYFHEKSIDN